MRQLDDFLNRVDVWLTGIGVAIVLAWLIVGLLFLKDLHGWQVWWGGTVGAIGVLFLVSGLARVIARRRSHQD